MKSIVVSLVLILIVLSLTIALIDKCNSIKTQDELMCNFGIDRKGPVDGGTEISLLCDKNLPTGSYITIGGKKIENSEVYVTEKYVQIIGTTPTGKEGIVPMELWDSSGKAIKLFGINNFTYTNETNASLVLKVNKMLTSSKLDHAKAKEYLNQISRNSPEWKNEGERLSMLVNKRIVLDEKRKKRTEGASIGMTKQDVLDSSWGKPRSINKTHTAYGTHEQWCYGGNNYLYFENGILTSIQN